MTDTEVVLEIGHRRTFARALDWPGWCRAGRDERAALDALDAARLRYRAVADRAGVRFPVRAGVLVVERLPGDGTTDFGAPGRMAEADARPTPAAEARRLAALVSAAWEIFDETVAKAPDALRPGPRGGGRDRDAITAHVREAEWSYARKLGLRLPASTMEDGQEATRAVILEVLGAPSEGPSGDRAWPVRYAAARIAWHVLDHAWEIEDRT